MEEPLAILHKVYFMCEHEGVKHLSLLQHLLGFLRVFLLAGAAHHDRGWKHWVLWIVPVSSQSCCSSALLSFEVLLRDNLQPASLKIYIFGG